MSINAIYSATGKFYTTTEGRTVPSAGMICTTLAKESYDYVGIESLERAMQEGEGAHRVACDYSLTWLGHLNDVVLPLVPEGHLHSEESWTTAMLHALNQVKLLFAQYAVEPIAVEQPSICSLYGFGGQPDLKCWMRWRGQRICAVWDYKRVRALALAHALKMECYRLLDGYQDCQSAFIAWLQKDGKPILRHMPINQRYKAAICGQAAAFNFQISERLLIP